jgi:hypothetical protein
MYVWRANRKVALGSVPESHEGLGLFGTDHRRLRWAGEARSCTVYGVGLPFFKFRNNEKADCLAV